jgi:hypothetical protein
LLGRFLSADTIVPGPKDPQQLNRYAYGLNNPVKYRDPSGHKIVCGATPDGCEDPWAGHPLQQPYPHDALDNAWNFATGLARIVVVGVLKPEAVPFLIAKMLEKAEQTPAAVMGTSIPSGFQSADEFRQFSSNLYSGLRSAGYNDATAIFQGSSVTGVKYTTGRPFDAGRVSDYDVALASPSFLLARANELGIGLHSGGTRTGPLTGAELEQLGLSGMNAELSQAVGRPVNFMIYQSAEAAISRSPSIVVPESDPGPLDVGPTEPIEPIP